MHVVRDETEIPRFNLRETLPALWRRENGEAHRQYQHARELERDWRNGIHETYTTMFGRLPHNTAILFKPECVEVTYVRLERAIKSGTPADWGDLADDTKLYF